MEEVFIIVPRSVTLDDVADVLRRSWTLDDGVGVPYVQTGPHSTAYVAEPEVTRTFAEELALDHPDLWDRVRGTVGDHRILSSDTGIRHLHERLRVPLPPRSWPPGRCCSKPTAHTSRLTSF